MTTTRRPSDESDPRSDSTVAIVAPDYRGSRGGRGGGGRAGSPGKRPAATSFAGIAMRTPYWVVTGALALLVQE